MKFTPMFSFRIFTENWGQMQGRMEKWGDAEDQGKGWEAPAGLGQSYL